MRHRTDGHTLADVHIPYPGVVVGVITTAAFAALLVSTLHLQFFHDEWYFVTHPLTSVAAWFAPYNGHWSTVPTLVYQVLLHLFGLGTHVPDEAVMLLTHAAAVVLLFRLVRRRYGAALGLAAALLFLVLGFGADDFLYCCSGEIDASVMFGLLAMDQLDASPSGRWHALVAGAALLLALASSAVGLAFAAAALVQAVLQRQRRATLVALLPIAGYAVWFLLVGRTGVRGVLQPSGGDVVQLAGYIAYGIGSAAVASGGAGDVTHETGRFLAAGVLLALTAVALVRRFEAALAGAAAGLVFLFFEAGLVRVVRFGILEAGANRYMYPACALLLLLVAGLLARVPARRPIVIAFAMLVVAAAYGNIHHLQYTVAFWNAQSANETTVLETLNALRGDPDLARRVAPDAIDDRQQLTVSTFFSAEAQYGAPVPALGLVPLEQRAPAAVDAVLRRVLSGGLILMPATPVACSTDLGTAAQLQPGTTQPVQVSGSGRLTIALGFAAEPQAVASFRVTTGAWTLRVPRLVQRAGAWRVSLIATTQFAARFCSA